MFTGIIECFGELINVHREGGNVRFDIKSPFTSELKVDQSVAHNGVCLTVTSVSGDIYSVTLIEETIKRTSFANAHPGDLLNLERAMPANGRFDGHIVQGHVDQTAVCKNIVDADGSRIFHFSYSESGDNITVEKGSVCVNGVSLTVVDSSRGNFSVHIIPYTLENTNFNFLKINDLVNLEFDIIGKYVKKLINNT
ncbi:MAG: riboflavin synthase [Cytophagaceae bacterium]